MDSLADSQIPSIDRRRNSMNYAHSILRLSFWFPLILLVVEVQAAAQSTERPELARKIPAFPGAEGYGSAARGGRGGRVIAVTNLKESGPGSLRAAIDAKGPRTVVFRVSGTIDADLNIRNDHITIAGQTAPGDGICIKGSLKMSANDVIVRYIRVRPHASREPSTLI
jgi:hypothetical protein